MYTVAISFKNGTKMRFYAQQFDIDVVEHGTSHNIHKYVYKDSAGADTPIYLTPKELAGIVVSPVLDNGRLSVVAE